MLKWLGERYMRMQTIRHEEGGFTLIELLIVIIIIGILAAIAIPVFLSQRLKAQQAASRSDTRNAATAELMYYADNNTFTDTLDPDLTAQSFRQSTGVQTTVNAAMTDANNYCVESSYAPGGDVVNGTTFHMADDSGGVVAGSCAP